MKKIIFIVLLLLTAFHFSAVFAASGSGGGGGGEVTKDGHLYYADEQGEPLDIPICKCPDDMPVTCRCMNDD